MHKRSVEELRAIHAKKMYDKTGNIILAMKAKHGDKTLSHPSIFDPDYQSWGKTGTGHKALQESAPIIAKYSLDPKSPFKIVTPISLQKGDKYERSDNSSVQKYLYKGSGKIIEMSPEKFLKLASPMNTGRYYDSTTGETTQRHAPKYDDESDYFPESIEHLRKDMGKGAGEIPQLAVKDNGETIGHHLQVIGHEGRHRAFVAKEKGIDKIPVLVTSDHSDNPFTEEQKDLIEKKIMLPERYY